MMNSGKKEQEHPGRKESVRIAKWGKVEGRYDQGGRSIPNPCSNTCYGFARDSTSGDSERGEEG